MELYHGSQNKKEQAREAEIKWKEALLTFLAQNDMCLVSKILGNRSLMSLLNVLYLAAKGRGETSEMQCEMSAQRKLEVHSYGLQMVKQSWLGELCWKDFGVKLT